MKKGIQDITRSYLGDTRASRWYLGSTMIFDQEISFDLDYSLLVVNLFGDAYGYADLFGGDLIPTDLLGGTILGMYTDATGSTTHIQVAAEIPGLEAITMYG